MQEWPFRKYVIFWYIQTTSRGGPQTPAAPTCETELTVLEIQDDKIRFFTYCLLTNTWGLKVNENWTELLTQKNCLVTWEVPNLAKADVERYHNLTLHLDVTEIRRVKVSVKVRVPWKIFQANLNLFWKYSVFQFSIAQFMSITWEKSVSRSPRLYFHDRTEHSKMCFGWFSATSVTAILTIVPQFLYLDVKKKVFKKLNNSFFTKV